MRDACQHRAPVPRPGQSDRATWRGSRRELRPELLERARGVGEDPFERVAEGTRFAQPALFCAEPRRLRAGAAARRALSPATRSASSARWSPAGALATSDGLRLVVAARPAHGRRRRAPPRRRCSRCSAATRRPRADRRRRRADASPTTTPPARSSSPAPPRRSATRRRGGRARRALKAMPPAGHRRLPLAADGAGGRRASARRSTAIELARAAASPSSPAITAAPFDDVRARARRAR